MEHIYNGKDKQPIQNKIQFYMWNENLQDTLLGKIKIY